MPSNQNTDRPQEEEWQDWAIAAQDGDKRAYTKLLKALDPFIRSVIVRSLANPAWADDIVQEVLLSIHKSLHTYAPERPFKPWLMAIISFRKTDFLRRHYKARDNKKTSLENPEFLGSHVTDSAHAGELKDIEAALAELPARQRKVFTMMKIEGFSAQEVANETGMSVSAVKVSVHRTANKLKEKLG